MRRHVAISGLLAYFIGLSAGDRAKKVSLHRRGEETVMVSNRAVNISIPSPEIPRSNNSTIKFDYAEDVKISTVRLRLYNKDGDKIIASTEFPPATAPPDASLSGGSAGDAFDDAFFRPGSTPNNLTIAWSKNIPDSVSFSNYLNLPLYLESEWTKSLSAGNSTSPLFAVYDKDAHQAQVNLEAALKGSSTDGSARPARPESTAPTAPSSTPTPSSPPGTSETPTQAPTAATSQPAATIGPQSALPAPNGLSKNGIIGVAVGVGAGGLLVAGILSWLFCFRRRHHRRGGGSSSGSRNAAHHTMPSYDSDVGGAHASMTGKETPVLLETPSRQSAYGGEGRPSIDPYAPYSDRSAPSPTMTTTVHYRGATTTTGTDVPAAAATSQTDLTWTNGAPTPTPVIASRYAHLVEEGMTEEEIRRLEDEERQLDAAIENAGRRRDT
ncbi:hypothetical protein F5B17DRAFT_253374 [Nemania serpens]|nr:hypothetical protein F5B17DRAFT_253374 [Nemania serpens]